MSGIGNFTLLRSLRDLLESEDTQQFPAKLNTDQIVVVVDLALLGANQPAPAVQPFNTVQFLDLNFSIAGINSFTRTIFDHANNAALIGRDARVIGVALEIGGPADVADQPMELYLQYGIGTVVPFYRLDNWEQTSIAGVWSREWSLAGATVDSSGNQGHISAGWGGFLPAGQSLDIVVRRAAGNWVAGTTATVRAIEVNVPTGRRLPG